MSKEALEYPKRALFLIPPEDLTIIGLDTDDDGTHPLADIYGNRLPLQEHSILFMMSGAYVPPILVTKDGDRILVVEGRQRTKAAREANRRLRARGEDPISLRATYQKDNLDDLGDTMVSTNSHQQDRGILDKCEKAWVMFQRGRDISTIALKQAVGPQIVRNRLKIHGLDVQLKEALREGACTQAQALDLAEKSGADQRAAGLAYLAAAEDPKPRAPKDPAPERVRRKRRSESTLRRATVDGSEARKAVASWMLEPTAPVDVLLSREDLPGVIREMAWALGEETT